MGREANIDAPVELPESGRCRDRRTRVVRRSNGAPAKVAAEAMGCSTFAMPALDNKGDRNGSVRTELHSRRAGDRRRVKPQRATSSSRGVGLKTCLVHTRIRRSPTRDGCSSFLVQGTHRLGPAAADIRQLSDIYPTNKCAVFARNLLISLAPRPGLEPGTYGLTATSGRSRKVV